MRTASVTIKQTVILIGVVVALVFVVTYATTILGKGGDSTNKAVPSGPETQLAFSSPTTVPPPTADKPEGLPIPWEWQTQGHHEFWFRNDRDDPVQVTLARVGCAACTKIELCVLPEGMKQLKPEELDARAQDPGLTWQLMEVTGNQSVTVPAHAAGGVRLSWQKKERASGPESIKAEFETESRKTTGHAIGLFVNLVWVDPVMVAAEDTLKDKKEGDISVGNLEAGDVKTVNLLCWSYTRTAFTLKPKPPDDPCLAYGMPEQLSEDDCKKVTDSAAMPSPILCAYRVPVTVRERTADGKQLDLGRFRRQVKFTSDATQEEGSTTITGVVRGDITVGTDPRERDLIVLGSFERSEGKSKEVTLTTERADLDLEIESKPEFLTAELREEKGLGLLGKTWTLTVTVPPNALDRPVPPHTYIVLKTKGKNPRRINIPVIGIAYVR